jgi:hypothetical protein
MVKFDALTWTAYAGPDPVMPQGERDADVAAAAALRDVIKQIVVDYLGKIATVQSNADLSEAGRHRQAGEVGREAIAKVMFAAEAPNSRRIMADRLAASPPPNGADVPSYLAPILHAKLEAMDALLRANFARECLAKKDPNAAIWLASLPASIALVSEAEAADLAHAVKVAADPRGASAAARMVMALRSVDDAARGAIRLIKEAASLPLVEGGPVNV